MRHPAKLSNILDITLFRLAFALVDINLSDEFVGTWGDRKKKTKELFKFLRLSFLMNDFYEQLLYINENLKGNCMSHDTRKYNFHL